MDHNVSPGDRRVMRLVNESDWWKLQGTRGLPYIVLGWSDRWYPYQRHLRLMELEHRGSKRATEKQLAAWQAWIDWSRTRGGDCI
jgi:hypothetical protein